MATTSTVQPPVSAGELRRELHFWEAIALSIAIMAPTAAMALNGVGVAALIGRAVPLAFIFATPYVVTNIGAIRFLWIGHRRAPLRGLARREGLRVAAAEDTAPAH
jgi:hypothetical protein